MKDVKASVEYAHAEIQDLKTENETRKVSTEEYKQRIEKLEKENQLLISLLIKARSMLENLIFFNMKETEKENKTAIIHKLLEEKMEMPKWKMLEGKLESTDHFGWVNHE